MPAETYINVGGSWVLSSAPGARVSGVWNDFAEIYGKVSGAWELVFELDTSQIGGDWGAYAAPPTIAFSVTSFDAVATFARLTFSSDGTYERNAGGTTTNEDWADDAPSTAGGDYQAKWERVSGDSPGYSTGWSENTWLAISADRWIQLYDGDPAIGGKLGQFDISIRQGTDDSTIVTRRVQLQASYFDEGGA